MTGRIILLRHGQTFSNIERLLDTRPPGAELTERGRDQAVRAGREIAEYVGERKLRMYCSVALRAQQTAQLAARSYEEVTGHPRFSYPVEVINGVHEIYAGNYEMDGSEDAHREYMMVLRGCFDSNPDSRLQGGESYVDLLGRYQPALENLAAGLGDDEDIVVVSHGAAIRIVSKHATGVDADFAFSGYMPNCGMTVMEPRGKDFGQWELRRWADLDLPRR